MPMHKGVFIPYRECYFGDGDCFRAGKCLGDCQELKHKQETVATLASKVADLEQRIRTLESHCKACPNRK